MTNHTEESFLAQKANEAQAVTQRFVGWMKEHPEIVGRSADALQKDFRRFRREAELLERAAVRPMCVGVFGASQAGKSYLISALARKGSNRLMADFGQTSLDFLEQINPPGGEESTGVVTRFTIHRNSNFDENFPVAMTLISETDVAKILGNTYHSDISVDKRKEISSDEIEQQIQQLESRIQAHQDETLYELEEYFEKHFPANVQIRALRPFWDRMANLWGNATVAQRGEFLSLLWGKNVQLTDIYNKLISTLEQLGYAREVCGSIEALHKPLTVMEASTLENLGHLSDTTVRVRGINGRIADIDKVDLAALIAELRIVVSEKPHDFFEHTDLLDFPGARSRLQKDEATKSGLGILFKRGKVAYLFQRYVEERELTSMLLCIGDGPQEVTEIKNMITPWLNSTHGHSPKDRQSKEIALFLVLTKMDLHFEPGDINKSEVIWQNRLKSSVVEAFANDDGKSGWVNAWTPNQCFKNTYWLRNPNVPQRATFQYDENENNILETALRNDAKNRISALKQGFLNCTNSRFFNNPTRAFDEALKLNDGGISYLLENLTPICRPEIKTTQVSTQIQQLQSRIQQKIAEYYVDSDLEKMLKKRKEAAIKTMRSLALCIEAQRFGQLINQLNIDEDTIRSIINRIEQEVPDKPTSSRNTSSNGAKDIFKGLGIDSLLESSTTSTFDNSDDDLAIKTRHEITGERVIASWVTTLHDIAVNNKMLDYFLFNEQAFDILVQEIVSGIKNDLLENDIVNLSERSADFPWQPQEVLHHKARLIANTINHYINFLGLDTAQKTVPIWNNPEKTEPLFNREKVSFGGQLELSEQAEPFDLVYGAHWIKAFELRIEKNVTAETGTEHINTEANKQLGNMLAILQAE